ncbi:MULTISPECIES: transposase [Microcystis]|uniref:transposase n=1 Tax=Microcystis TaxID=1125 RepID=UPI0002F6A492
MSRELRDFGWHLEHLKRTDEQPGFTVIPKRWVVELTYSWFGHYRRLSKDYEFLPTTGEMYGAFDGSTIKA